MKSYPAAGCCYLAGSHGATSRSDYAENPMSFSSDAWARNAALYEKRAPCRSTRSWPARRAFRHYMIQDAHYLVAFGRALAVAAAKAQRRRRGPVRRRRQERRRGRAQPARRLHEAVRHQRRHLQRHPLTPASHHYTSYLIATAWSAPYPWPWPRCCPSGSTPRSAATSTPAPPSPTLQRLDRHLCRRGIPHPGPRSHRVRGPRRGTRVRRNGQGYARGIHTPRAGMDVLGFRVSARHMEV